MDIYLSKKVISDLKLSDDVIGAYVALKKIHYSLEKSNYYISINMMLYELFGNNNYNRSDYTHISDGLIGLHHFTSFYRKKCRMRHLGV